MCEKNDIELSIIVPVYNESETITLFHERLITVLEQLSKSFEIIYINDGSSDTTLEILINLYVFDKHIKIINLSRNFGKEKALTAGIDYSSGQGIIPIDADLQDPPEVIIELVKKWEEGYDIVNAKRITRKGDSFIKKITARLFYKVIRSFSKMDIPDNTGDFRLIDRKAAEALKRLREYHRFMKGLFSWIGFKQTTVLYERAPRYAGKTKWNYLSLLNFAIDGITSFSHVPLRISSLIGVIVSLISFGFGIYFVFCILISGNQMPGYSTLIIIISFLCGVLLMTNGIMGEYIGRIYNETKHRDLYIVRDIFDAEADADAENDTTKVYSGNLNNTVLRK
ncbi:MAG: glycosyltransferase family 2 protein [Spirochaetales bacterium]|nr:glycosyltransferase family 2 protein [Spirochaetales bacterium]